MGSVTAAISFTRVPKPKPKFTHAMKVHFLMHFYDEAIKYGDEGSDDLAFERHILKFYRDLYEDAIRRRLLGLHGIPAGQKIVQLIIGPRRRYRSRRLPASEAFKMRIEALVEEKVFIRCKEGRAPFEINISRSIPSLLLRSSPKMVSLTSYIQKHVDESLAKVKEKKLLDERRKTQKILNPNPV
eukprot:sb/3471438/